MWSCITQDVDLTFKTTKQSKQPNEENQMEETTRTVEAELVKDDVIEKRSSQGLTLDSLASMEEEQGIAIFNKAHALLDAARKASIKLTKPGDWILFKQPSPPKGNGRITAYLQDAGCARVRDLFGIDIYDVKMERIPPTGPGFMYICTASGSCRLTRQTVENAEGGRSSNDDFITKRKEKEGDKYSDQSMELDVRKMARANCDGRITRALAGLGQVSGEDLEAAGINLNHCIKGRGFSDDRGGAIPRQTEAAKAPTRPMPRADGSSGAPVCQCGEVMRLIPAGTHNGKPYAAFYGCSDRSHKESSVKKADWDRHIASKPPAEREPGDEPNDEETQSRF